MPAEVLAGILIFITVFLIIVIIRDNLFAILVGEYTCTEFTITRIKSGIKRTIRGSEPVWSLLP
jgi:hypothetical protein